MVQRDKHGDERRAWRARPGWQRSPSAGCRHAALLGLFSSFERFCFILFHLFGGGGGRGGTQAMSFVRRPHCSARARPAMLRGSCTARGYVQQWAPPYRYRHTAGGGRGSADGFCRPVVCPFIIPLLLLKLRIKKDVSCIKVRVSSPPAPRHKESIWKLQSAAGMGSGRGVCTCVCVCVCSMHSSAAPNGTPGLWVCAGGAPAAAPHSHSVKSPQDFSSLHYRAVFTP